MPRPLPPALTYCVAYIVLWTKLWWKPYEVIGFENWFRSTLGESVNSSGKHPFHWLWWTVLSWLALAMVRFCRRDTELERKGWVEHWSWGVGISQTDGLTSLFTETSAGKDRFVSFQNIEHIIFFVLDMCFNFPLVISLVIVDKQWWNGVIFYNHYPSSTPEPNF